MLTAGLGLGSAMAAARPGAVAGDQLGSAGGLGPGITRRLDRAIPKAMLAAGIPGAIVGLWTPRGSYVRTFGVSNRATGAGMHRDFYQRIGSVTKMFTASAILQLVDRGKIRLDDPIAKYIPHVPDGHRITIHELGRMQSGLYPYNASEQMTKEYYSNPERSFTPEQLLKFSFSHKLLFPPGTHWVYDNTNYVLLGLVVEKLSGQPLGDYFRDHLFRPFGLRHTFLPAGPRFPSPHAHGYTINVLSESVVDATHWNPSWAWAAGALISKLSDLRRWAPIVATGKGLLTPKTQRERLQTVRVPPPAHRDVRYGFGIFTNAGWIGHNGSIPGYETVCVYLPDERTTMVLLINTDVLVGAQVEPSSPLGTAITSIATPGHVYGK